MKSHAWWHVLSLAVLLALASASLVACGGGGDPYVGHRTGPDQGTIIIAPSHTGWWTVRTDSKQ